MYWDIVSAEYLEGYQIRLSFRDGKSGTVDLRSVVDAGGVFAALRDVEVFKAFTIDPEWHVLSWQDGKIDLAPETIYERATGCAPAAGVAEERPPYGGV